MNYDHLYHAGNHADVLKHLILLACVEAVSRKPSAWCYLDTHAGRGLYDLSKLARYDAPEHHTGVQLLKAASGKKPALCERYLSIIEALNTGKHITMYPGSTFFVRALARPQDRLIACELEGTFYLNLKKTFHQDTQVAIHHTDGYFGLKAFLPPKEKRGVVLIDPPYETGRDWQQTLSALTYALAHFQSGHYLIWYPLKDQSHRMGWLRQLRAATQKEVLLIEMCPFAAAGNQLYGSGIAMINPFWQFKEQFEPVLHYVWDALSINKVGSFRLLPLDLVVK